MIARALPKYCSWNTGRHGRKRVGFRKGFYSTYRSGVPCAEDFMQRYHAALDGNARQLEEFKEDRVEFGTIDAVTVNFYRSTDFQKLKHVTQRVRKNVVAKFRVLQSHHGSQNLERGCPLRCTKAADQERNAKQALANLVRSESEQACQTIDPRLDKTGER